MKPVSKFEAAERLDDLRQEEAEAVLRDVAAHVDEAERDDPRVAASIAATRAPGCARALRALGVEPALQPLALLGFEPVRLGRPVGEVEQHRDGHDQMRGSPR